MSTSERTAQHFTPLTIVVAAVIRDEQERLLLAQRPQGRHMAGLWEFPGGKIHEGEHPAHALQRELKEELGVEAVVGAPLEFAIHEEPGLRVLLLFFSTRIAAGEPLGREGQAVVWVPRAELEKYQTPPADAPLIQRLCEKGL
jgi:8-oxo-dGTP diphosphatase